MKNKMLKLATGLFCLGLAATFTACGDDDSSSSPKSNAEMVSCYIYNVVDAENNEIKESCTQAEKGTAYGDSVKVMCDLAKLFVVPADGDKVEQGSGCKEDKVLYSCDKNMGTGNLEYYYYTLDEEQSAAVKGLKGNAACDTLVAVDNEELPDLPLDDEDDDDADTDGDTDAGSEDGDDAV